MSGLRTAKDFENYCHKRGSLTTVKGEETRGVWNECEVGRVQRYIKDEELARSCFDVFLPAYTLGTPWSASVGGAINRLLTLPSGEEVTYTGKIERIDPETVGDDVVFVLALVILTGPRT